MLRSYQISKILEGHYRFPMSVLGLHIVADENKKYVVIRYYNPRAISAGVIKAGKRNAIPMPSIHPNGIFEAKIEDTEAPFDYKIKFKIENGREFKIEDTYNPKFKFEITDEDAYLFGKGEHFKIYEKLGAHEKINSGVKGVHFAVWAPCAKYVSVAGAFNDWSGKTHPMTLTKNGIWELFIPGLSCGTYYKYVIRSRTGRAYVKSDPYAFATQLRPKKSSVVYDLEKYKWRDSEWLSFRQNVDHLKQPISIYEVHLGSWIRKEDDAIPFHNYREIAEDLIPYVKGLGFTHVELLPIMEHPLDESWGYQTTNYYAPTQRYGSPEDFMYFVDECHKNKIGVIIDWVPAHFPKDPHGLGRFDGSHLYEHADPRQGVHPDWKTYIFNYGRHEVKNFLLANALFWIEKYHVDGLRVDAVASMLYLDYSRKAGEWVPNKYGGNKNLEAISFLRKFNRIINSFYHGVLTIAEESTAWYGVTQEVSKGGLNFTYKWNMGWMHDALEYFRKPSAWRRQFHNLLTFPLSYAFNEKYILVLSHDEVVHGKRSLIRKMPGDKNAKFANLRLLYGFLFAHPGKKLLFMGGEFAQWKEWGEDRELDWYLLDHEEHRKIQAYIADLNKLYANESSLHSGDCHYTGFKWIDGSDAQNSVIAFLRCGERTGDSTLFVFNASGQDLKEYAIGVPQNGLWKEIFNSNASIYGGDDRGNFPGVNAQEKNMHGQTYSILLNLPALTMMAFKIC